MKATVLVLTLLALIIISMVAVYSMPFGLRGGYRNEGFQTDMPSVPPVMEEQPMPEAEPSMPQPIPPAAPKPMSITTTKAPKKGPTVSTPANQAMMNATPPTMNTPPVNTVPPTAMPTENSADMAQGFQNATPSMNQANQLKNVIKEGFRTNYAEVSGGARDQYQPIGAFDGVALPTGNNVSAWRYTSPDEPLLGAPFEVGNDSLFMFKNNQCKPSCCGSSLSCSGGCVCTTPDQRQYIASRGGNRTRPAED
jgi:hypothetical protein